MTAVETYEGVRLIARWDREQGAFYEAVTRIEAELRYNPSSHACRWPRPDGPVRHEVIGSGISGATKERLCKLVSQLSWLLPTLERWLEHSRADGLERIEHYRGIFKDACDLIDLKKFRIDENADSETLCQQADALSRAMLLKSDLLLIIVQFDLLSGRDTERERPAPKSSTRLKAVA